MSKREKLKELAHKYVDFVLEDHTPHWLYFPVKVTMFVPIIAFVKAAEIKEKLVGNEK